MTTMRDLAPGVSAPLSEAYLAASIGAPGGGWVAFCHRCGVMCCDSVGHPRSHRRREIAKGCAATLCGCARVGPVWGAFPGEV